MSDPKKPWSLTESLDERQREKLAAHPMELDFRAALALVAKQLEDLMDDKHLALQEELSDMRAQLRRHEIRFHWIYPFKRLREYCRRLRIWWHYRKDPRYTGFDD